jgi:hypothetical protein
MELIFSRDGAKYEFRLVVEDNDDTARVKKQVFQGHTSPIQRRGSNTVSRQGKHVAGQRFLADEQEATQLALDL